MITPITSAVIFGAALVSAVPWGPLNFPFGGSYSSTGASSSATSGPSTTSSAPTGPQTPFTFPLANGFPNVTNATLTQLEENAHGTLWVTGRKQYPSRALLTLLSDTL